jgi:hypothetical protein
VTVVAYADDVTVLLTTPDDIRILQEIIHKYERATGARLNISKSHAMAVGSWDPSTGVMGITYSESVKILGFPMTRKTNISQRHSWEKVTAQVKRKTKGTYYKDLGLEQRIQYVYLYLLAKIWHTAQIFPIWPQWHSR